MQAYGRSEFADRFAEAAADSNYSAYPQLQVESQYDIRAAAEALWATGQRENIDVGSVELDEGNVITVLLTQEQRWDDEGELVSREFEEYWDATDTHGFSASLTQRIQEELTRGFLTKCRTDHVVVNNSHGIWLFRKDVLTSLVKGPKV